MQKRATMLAATARMLPVPICGLVRLSEVFFFMYTISGAAVARNIGRVSCKRGGPLALGVCGRAVPCEQGCVRPGVYGGGAARTGEHGEERGEEAPPRHVEGARVRVAVVEDDELDRLVLGVHLHEGQATA